MKLLLILVFTIYFHVEADSWYQHVDADGNPIPVPQIFHQNAIPHYPYHWHEHDNSAINDHKPAEQPQSEVVGDPYRPCSENEFQCTAPKQCIPIAKRCDNRVDCVDGSDEFGCSCASRLAPEKLCDFYEDCPLGEDELGCLGCSVDQYSCYRDEDEYKSSGGAAQCFHSTQRCDRRFDCMNHVDESRCVRILKEVTAVTKSFTSATENGILYFNVQDKFYPVCNDELQWSRMECSYLLSPNKLREAKIEPIPTGYNGKYIITGLEIRNHHAYHTIELVGDCRGAALDWKNRLLRVNCSSDSTSCGRQLESKDFSRIAGGHEAKSRSNPWLVGLFANGKFLCGGSIIGEEWILTAAHCLYEGNKRLSKNHYVEIRAGIRRLSSFSPEQQTVRVARGVIHKGFNKTTFQNDIALLKLESALTFNHLVQPICLPTEAHVGNITEGWIWGPEQNSFCKIAGWGSHTHRDTSPVDRQMEVCAPISSTCDPDNDGLTFCAGFPEGGSDAFVGDSGGPLVCQSKADRRDVYLAGIVSSGCNRNVDNELDTQCGMRDTYGEYTRTTRQLQWIEAAKKNMTQNEKFGTKFRVVCPGVKCSSYPNICVLRDGIADCIDGEDEIMS